MTGRDDGEAPYRYAGFGLDLESDFFLGELIPAAGKGAGLLQVRRQDIPCEWNGTAGDPFIRLSRERQLLRWSRVGTFLIPDDRTILVDPVEEADRRLVAFPLLGPVMAVLLHRRGRLVLHASAVEVNGRAVVLLGDKGAGKSTLAGALVSAGHRLLTDDLVVLTLAPDGGTLLVEATAGQLKLYHEARNAIDLTDAAIVDGDLDPAITKRQHRLGGTFRLDPAPLGPVLALAHGQACAFHRAEPVEALEILLRFSYIARFGNDALWPESASQHFSRCAALSQKGVVGRFIGATGLERLIESVRAIETLCATSFDKAA